MPRSTYTAPLCAPARYADVTAQSAAVVVRERRRAYAALRDSERESDAARVIRATTFKRDTPRCCYYMLRRAVTVS